MRGALVGVAAGWTLAVQAAAPVAPQIPPQQLTEGRSGNITVPAFADPDGDALTYTYSGLPFWLSVYNPSVNPRYLLGTPPYTESGSNSSKTYWITVTATDPGGERASRAFSLTVLNANAPPTRPESILPQTASEGTFFSYTVPVYPDPDGDAVSYSYSGLPNWLTVYNPQANPRYLYGKPPYSESGLNTTKQYWITVTATDSYGSSSSRAFSLTVINVNAVPQAPVIADLTFQEGSLIQYSVPKFTDVDGDALTYAIEGLPAWLTVYNPARNPRYLYGRVPSGDAAPNASRDYPIRVTATDPSSASASATFTLRVVPAIFIAPTSLSFGTQLAGTASAAQTVTITNSGLVTLGITAITLTGTDAAAFAQTTDCGSSLAVGASCTLSVAFTPATSGAKAASLSIASDAAGSPHLVSVGGTGIAPALDVTPGSISFGDQRVGTASAAQAVTLTNVGSAPLAISEIALTGTDSGSFGQSTDCGASLAVGSSCTASVTFAPAAVGPQAGSLSIATDADGSPALVALGGAGVAPPLVIEPASLSFGGQYVGTASAAQTVTLANSGTAERTISGITVTGADSAAFGRSTDCGASLAVGSNCTVSVTFTPATSGEHVASLSITTDAAGGPQSVGLSGLAVQPQLLVNPTSISFTSVQPVNSTSAAKIVTLTNAGTLPLTINDVVLTGADRAAFGQTNDCGSSLAAYATCTIAVTFTPTLWGGKSAVLEIVSDAGATTITIEGVGVDSSGIIFERATAWKPAVGVAQDGSVVAGFSTLGSMQRAYIKYVASSTENIVGSDNWNSQFTSSSRSIGRIVPSFDDFVVASLAHATSAGSGGYAAVLAAGTLNITAGAGGPAAQFCRFSGVYQNSRRGFLRLTGSNNYRARVARFDATMVRVAESASATVARDAGGYDVTAWGSVMACGASNGLFETDDPYFVVAKMDPSTAAISMGLYRVDGDTTIAKIGPDLTGVVANPGPMDLAVNGPNGVVAYQKYVNGVFKIYARPFAITSSGIQWSAAERLISRDFVADYARAYDVSLTSAAGSFVAAIQYADPAGAFADLNDITIVKLGAGATPTELASIDAWATWTSADQYGTTLECCSNGKLLLASAYGGIARIYALNADGTTSGIMAGQLVTMQSQESVDGGATVTAAVATEHAPAPVVSSKAYAEPGARDPSVLSPGSDRPRRIPQVSAGANTVSARAQGDIRFGENNRRVRCSAVESGKEQLSLFRLPGVAAQTGLSWFYFERRQGESAGVRELLGGATDYALAGREFRPKAGIQVCGSVTYAWRDGYAPEAWLLSRSSMPLWRKELLDPSMVLAVTGVACTTGDGLELLGATELPDSASGDAGGLRDVRIDVSPYLDEVPDVAILGQRDGTRISLRDSCDDRELQRAR